MRKPSAYFILLLLCLSTVLVGCNQLFFNLQPTPTHSLDEQQIWIKQHAIVLQTTDPNVSLADLAPFQQIVGNASLVGLGEDTHGSHEFFTMKQRLLEFLVEKMGFTMFAIEGSWSAGEKINQYVLNGQGNAADVLQQFHFWTWNTQEVLALLKWIRAYDADPAHIQKVSFAGFDCQYIETNTYDNVVQYLQAVDPQSVARVAQLYQGLRPDPALNMDQYTTAYTQLPQSTKQQYTNNAQHVYDLLNQHKTTYTALSSPQAFAQALQEARIILQGAQYASDDQSQQVSEQEITDRETFMAENIAWLHEHSNSGAKIVLWAHDAHIAKSYFAGSSIVDMGGQLRERYQSQYLAIGMSFYEGSFNARGIDNQGNYTSVQPFHIQADQDTYNYELGTLGLSLYALDLRDIPAGPVGNWLNGPQPFLEIGSVYSPVDMNDYNSLTDLPQQFDVMISIQNVTASQLIPLKD